MKASSGVQDVRESAGQYLGSVAAWPIEDALGAWDHQPSPGLPEREMVGEVGY